MRRLIQFATRLYPASWRQRYGVEFAALLEDIGPDWRTSLNVIKAAIEMHLQTWNLGKMLAITGVVGALVALGVSFSIPARYSSMSVLNLTGPPQQATYDYLAILLQRVESPTLLVRVINDFGLYKNERARMPIEEVVENMRKRISIRPIPPATGMTAKTVAVSAAVVQFVSDDPVTAQNVTEDLTSRLIYQNLRDGSREGRRTVLEVIEPASLPQSPSSPNRTAITAAGLTTGLVMGFILTGLRRLRRLA